MVNILDRRSHMLYKNPMFLVALGFICTGVPSAQTDDLYITLEGGGGTIGGKKAAFSLVNRCMPLSGF
jgi:hypothetical protein